MAANGERDLNDRGCEKCIMGCSEGYMYGEVFWRSWFENVLVNKEGWKVKDGKSSFVEELFIN